MIKVDRAVGSREFHPRLQAHGLPAKLASIAGDFAFRGHGPNGARLKIGIEFKKLPELLAAISSGRFIGHQVGKMRDTYDVNYLLIEGGMRAEPGSGILQTPRRGGWVDAGFSRKRFMYDHFVSFLAGLTIQANFHVLHVSRRHESLRTIAGLYHWWDKPWEDHKTLKVIYGGIKPSGRLDDELGLTATFTRITPYRAMLAQIPALGWEYSGQAETVFDGPEEMMAATLEEWAALRVPGQTKDGRQRPRLGRGRAARIMDVLH